MKNLLFSIVVFSLFLLSVESGFAKGTCSTISPRNACGTCYREGDCGGTGRGKLYCHRIVQGCNKRSTRNSSKRSQSRSKSNPSISDFNQVFERQLSSDGEFRRETYGVKKLGDINRDGYIEFVAIEVVMCDSYTCGNGIDKNLVVYSYRNGRLVELANYSAGERNTEVSFTVRNKMFYLKVDDIHRGQELIKLKLVGKKLVTVN